MEISQAIQNMSPRQLMSLMQSQTGVTALEGQEGGDFFALMLQLLAGMSEGETENPFLSLLEGGQPGEEEERYGSDLAAQLAAEMLAPNAPGMMDMLQSGAAEITDNQMLQLIGSFAGVNPQKAQQLYFLMQPADRPADPALAQKEAGGRQERPEAAEKGFLELAGYSAAPVKETAQEGQSSLQFSGSFRQAVAEAQKQLGSQKQEEELETVDVESLQNMAEARRGEIQEARAAAAKSAPELPQPLTEQIRTGIQGGLAEGKSEFVVKLKPEGLGEITVRLTEGTDGAMTLNLTASNVQTVKLLNEELAGLREALRPYGTEVNQAVSQPQESSYADGGYTGAQFDSQHGQQAYSGQHGHGGRQTPFQDYSYEEDGAQEEAQLYSADGLNAYI
ncbi:MAG: hypothetical protein HFG26_04095 [Provencibacterium sp.]|jgi:flagellar hook-length control protein FliK|nr:hypothetical protein [Provencibacterium sp.]